MTAKTQVPWTDEERLRLAAFSADVPHDAIAALFPRHTPQAVKVQRRRLGIYLSHAVKSQIAKVTRSKRDDLAYRILPSHLSLDSMGSSCAQVLLGHLLGDGCVKVNRGGRDYTVYGLHSGDQATYAEWKIKMLSELRPTSWVRDRHGVRVVEFQTPRHTLFTEMRYAVYGEGSHIRKGHIPKEYVERLRTLGLLVWYLDNGSLSGRNCILSSKVFPVDDMEMAVAVLNKNLGLGLVLHVSRHREGLYKGIYFSRSDRQILMPAWRKLFHKHALPDGMLYKLEE